jgi:hypothetical protein
MKIGDRVEVVAIPEGLPETMGTRALFQSCIGRVFPIVGLKEHLVELQVGELVGQPSYMHSIWIERDYVRPA